jgi:hypothetical protein
MQHHSHALFFFLLETRHERSCVRGTEFLDFMKQKEGTGEFLRGNIEIEIFKKTKGIVIRRVREMNSDIMRNLR